MIETNKQKILEVFDTYYPNVGCELMYRRDFELLIAVVLSAQTTDAAVNKVTVKLFEKFPELIDLAQAPVEDLAEVIKSIGLYKDKSKHIKGIAQVLLDQFNGKVPANKEALLTLPGVGIKTANVVRAELFRIPEIAVDTHVYRIARRLGFTNNKDTVITTEKKLKKALPVDRYILTHHQMIHFGRYFCKAKKPNCGQCDLVHLCKEKNKNLEK
jgi:endonuclease III